MTETSNWIQQVIQIVAPCGTSSGTIKGCFLEFLFLFGSLITLLIGFGDFNLNLWDSPVAKVSKMNQENLKTMIEIIKINQKI